MTQFDDAVRAQLAYHEEQCDGLAERAWDIEDRLDMKPKPNVFGDDWTEWGNWALREACLLRSVYHAQRIRRLKTWGVPMYCPNCEERPEGDWLADNCVDCSWSDWMEADARRCAKEIVSWLKYKQEKRA